MRSTVLVLFFYCFTNSVQDFLPLQDNAESIFYYEIIGAGQVNGQMFGFDSKFNLNVIKLNLENKLLINITESSGTVGKDTWSAELMNALEIPFNITLDKKGAPTDIEYQSQKETNYTIARKNLIFKQFTEIYSEHKKYVNTSKKAFNKVQELHDLPFGTCQTKVNVTTSLVYFSADYEATGGDCSGKIDPFYTLDMDVEIYPQSEFQKTFAFTIDGFQFQYVRLDARIKLKSDPEMDVEIYTLITFKNFNSFIEEDAEDSATIEATTHKIQ